MEATIESTAVIAVGKSYPAIWAAGKSPSILLIPHFKQFVAFLLFGVPEVRAVLMHQQGKLLRVYIVVKEYDFAVNERIYDKEEHLIDVFGNVDFDFHITSQAHANDSDLEVILSR